MIVRRRVHGVAGMALAYLLGLAIIPFLARGTIVRLARRLGGIGFRISGKTRRIALANLDLAFGNTISSEEKHRIARQSFQSFALVLIDLFWFARHTDERLAKYVTIAPSAKVALFTKPAIVVTGHFGNWEVFGQTFARIDPPFLAVAAHLKNSGPDRLLTKLRQGGSQKVAYKEGAMRAVIRVLDEGGKVGLVLDQNVLPNSGGMFVDFFGLPVPISSTAEKLSRKKGVPILLGSCMPDDKGFYDLTLPLSIPPPASGERDGTVTQAIARAFEAEIRRNPGQWLWMYKRWKYVRPGGQIEKYPFYAKQMTPSEEGKKQRGTT